MATGREIDAQIAEKVMRLALAQPEPYEWQTDIPSEQTPGTFLKGRGFKCARCSKYHLAESLSEHYCDCVNPWDVPPYSTDISAAMQVEDRIAELGLQTPYCDELTNIVASDCGKTQLGAMRFDLIHATPKQRCLAALAAVGEEK